VEVFGGPEQQRQRTNAWSPGQRILNGLGARIPEHTFNQPVPITARIVWADDGEEFIATVAAGWSGQNVYVREYSRPHAELRTRLTTTSASTPHR
jgi:hypothetical protein